MVDLSPFRHLYPFKSHFLNIEGYRLHYIDEGKGDVLLMLHGNPTWSFYYRNLIQAFSKKYRVIVPDHMGCGLSDKPQFYHYTLATHVYNLTTLIDYLELKDITLIFHDWGGPIGMSYAHAHKENIKRFVVFNSAAFLETEFELKIPLRIKLCKFPIFGPLMVRRLNAFAWGGLLMATEQKKHLTQDVRSGYLAPYNCYKNRIALLRFVQDIPWHDKIPSYPLFEEMTNKLNIFSDHPMLIIWGEKDFCFTHRFLMAWEDFFPNAWVKIISNAGHYVVEDAYEKIIPWIEDFLNKFPK